MSLRQRMLTMLALVLFSTLLGIGAGVSLFVYRTEQEAWQGRQLEAARNGAESVAVFIEHLIDSLYLITLLDGSRLQAQPQLLAAALQKSPALLELIYLDPQGRILANAHRDNPLLADLFTIPQATWYQRAAAGENYLGSIQMSPSGQPYMILAVPAADGSVVAGRLTLTMLWQLVGSIRFGNTGQAYVVNRDGRIVAHSQTEVVLANTYVTFLPPSDQSSALDQNRTYVNFAGKRVVGTVTSVPKTGWQVITELETEEAYAVSRIALKSLGGGMLLFALMVVLITGRLLEQVIFQPLARLRTGAERIGRGEMDHRIPIRTQNEVGQVAATFNQMADRLHERDLQLATRSASLSAEVVERRRAEAALQAFNSTLEKTVAERTRQLQEAEAKYRLLVEQIPAVTYVANMDTSHSCIYVSPQIETLLGFPQSSWTADPDFWCARIHPDDRERVLVEADLAFAKQRTFQAEYRMLNRQHQVVWVLDEAIQVQDDASHATLIQGVIFDISDRKYAEEQLRHDALHDGLTGLPNRVLFLDRLGQACERTKRLDNYRFALLFMDLDRFKVINDSLGHSTGDQLLIQFGRRLANCVRSMDTIARLGGDEFVILLDGVGGLDEVTTIANRIQEELKQPFLLDSHPAFSTVSIGIVLSNNDPMRPEDLMRDADIAMYLAKAKDGNQYQIFDRAMRAHAMERLELETDLQQALEREEFRLHYQPIISLEKGKLMGFEALLRWHHPRRGMISPAVFIPVAEETGLIIPIGSWVLREATAQLQRWQTLYPVTPPLAISVNISAKQFSQGDLLQEVDTVLAETGLAATSLKLEITESVLMKDAQAALRVLSGMRALGIQVEIDDFGTGYSSLNYINKFPIDVIKIDRSFVAQMADSNNLQVVQAILAFAKSLNMAVIAEGIETDEQLVELLKMECQYGQGYLFSKPVEEEVAETLIASHAQQFSLAVG